MASRLAVLVLFGLCSLSWARARAWAHRFAPGVLSLAEETGRPGRFSLRFVPPEVPGTAPLTVEAIQVAPPCRLFSEERVLDCGGRPPSGVQISIPTLVEPAQVLLSITLASGQTRALLRPGNPSYTATFEQGPRRGAWHFLVLGVTHILSGADHVLFLLCLVLGTPTLRALLGPLSAFTLAHCVTLCLAALGFVRLPSWPVEALIAFSIVALAREVVLSRKRPARTATALVFGFGLLHGLGFASGLADLEALLHPGGPALDHGPKDLWAPIGSLLCFNLGIELGQLLLVALLVPVVNLLLRRRQKILGYALGALGSAWFFDRILPPP